MWLPHYVRGAAALCKRGRRPSYRTPIYILSENACALSRRSGTKLKRRAYALVFAKCRRLRRFPSEDIWASCTVDSGLSCVMRRPFLRNAAAPRSVKAGRQSDNLRLCPGQGQNQFFAGIIAELAAVQHQIVIMSVAEVVIRIDFIISLSGPVLLFHIFFDF